MLQQVSSLALAAALVCSAAASGCYPAYSSTATYKAGDWVSNVEGQATYNYQCQNNANAAFCSITAYAPGSVHWNGAWNKQTTACTGVVASVVPTNACPAGVWSVGTSYNGGDIVAVAGNTAGVKDVYQCKSVPMNAFCGQESFSPGIAQYWDEAWIRVGQCLSGLVPVSAPVPTGPATSPVYNPVPPNLGTCPPAWSWGAAYVAGSQVSKDFIVYQCKTGAMGAHCPQAGYEPATTHGGTDVWRYVWDQAGVCDGAPATVPLPVPVPVPVVPVPVPVPVVPVPVPVPTLPFIGGCPAYWSGGATYEAGDRVVYASGTTLQVYQCKPAPMASHCGEASYAPGAANFLDAWIVIGTCSGSMAPTLVPTTSAPTVPPICFYTDPATGAEVQVGLWDSTQSYVTGAVVRVGGNRFKCKPHPNNSCDLASFAPNTDPAGNWINAWDADGDCVLPSPTVSPSPTSTPSNPGPTKSPSNVPSAKPSVSPSKTPSAEPSSMPSDVPSALPNFVPSEEPSMVPSKKPSGEPSLNPSDEPSGDPSSTPSDEPSVKPSMEPSMDPSDEPSDEPSQVPTGQPSKEPSDVPSLKPSAA